jgi:tetratricopeptide (TPR) repeat protein
VWRSSGRPIGQIPGFPDQPGFLISPLPDACYVLPVSNLLIGLLGALVATNQPQVVSNLIVANTGISIAVPDPNDPVEKAYQKLLADDDAAQEEVDQWIRDNQAFAAQGGGAPKAVLNERIKVRFAPVRQAYENFLQSHPEHVRARLAYGSFLLDIHDESGAEAQWQKARQLDPRNPAAWNNLADFYADNGSVKTSFEYYARAIELNPIEPTYYHNLATIVYFFRKDAMEFYGCNEQQVFDRAFELYRKAMKLDPQNFALASDVAQTYYGVSPLRTDDALQAWTNALQIARDDLEREGVYVHFARIKLKAGRFAEARRHLDAITHATYADLKKQIARNLDERESQARQTNVTSSNIQETK